MAVEAALARKGLTYDKIALTPGEHTDEMQRVYGEGNSTVPGMLVDGRPVHGSRPIMATLEQLAADPPLSAPAGSTTGSARPCWPRISPACPPSSTMWCSWPSRA
jgi:glutathione S-transferase